MATAAVWYGLLGKANGRAKTLVFPFRGGGKKLRILLQCISGHDFLYPRTTTVSDIENYPAPACLVVQISGTVSTVLRPLKSEVLKFISPRINVCL